MPDTKAHNLLVEKSNGIILDLARNGSTYPLDKRIKLARQLVLTLERIKNEHTQQRSIELTLGKKNKAST